jgi:fucose permease
VDDLRSPEPPGFARDRLTVLTYLLAGVFGYTFASLGPAMPLLRDDLGIGRTLGGLHFTLIALGAIVSGFLTDRAARRWGRRRVFWTGSGVAALGALLVGIGWHPAVTLSGAALIGGFGSAMLATLQSTLSDRHAGHRAVVLTEANTATAAGTVVPPLVIGVLVAAGIGWRPALVVPVLAWSVVFALRRRESFPTSPQRVPIGQRGALPGVYWLYWAALVPSVGAEWCIGAWGAGYLVDVAGTSEGAASAAMTAFFGSMVVGRIAGARLARTRAPAAILFGSLLTGSVGFGVFWAGTTPAVIVPGLFLSGLGIAPLFPMLLSLAVGTAPQSSDVATARVSVAAGSAVVFAPLTLGWIADRTGIRTAFGVVPGLFAMIAVFTLAAGSRAIRGRVPNE